MNRRQFLQACSAVVALAMVPVRWVRHRLFGDGVTDDTEAMQALLDGEPVEMPDGSIQQSGVISLPVGRTYRVTDTLEDNNA